MRHLQLVCLALSLAVNAESKAAPPIIADGLLQTHWRQDGPFAQYTPNRAVLGCWSTAYAQIMYYHRMTPTGRVAYQCSSGANIDVDLDQYKFDLDHFALAADGGLPTELEQAALYSYATAVAIGKDFGTSKYKRLLNSADDLERHFAVDAEIYVHLGKNPPMSADELAQKLRSEHVTHIVDDKEIVDLLDAEIAARRPVYFHFGNLKDFGHSTVIDGIRRRGTDVQVHINYGAAEVEPTRWYDLFAPISQPDDVMLRAFVTIRPIAAPALATPASGHRFDPASVGD